MDCGSDGGRTWFCRYQVGHGREGRVRRSHRLGSFDRGEIDYLTIGQAKDKAIALRVGAKSGVDAFNDARPGQATGDTFGTLFSDWWELHAKVKKSSWTNDEAMWHRHVKSRMGALVATGIKRRDAAAMFDDITRSKQRGG